MSDQLHRSFRVSTVSPRAEHWLKIDTEHYAEAGVELEVATLEHLGALGLRCVPELLGWGRGHLIVDDQDCFMVTRHIAGARLDRFLEGGGVVDWDDIAVWLSEFGRLQPNVAHGSFDTSNVIVDSTGLLAGVIDFEATREGSMERDIAWMLTDLIEMERAVDARALLDACSSHLPFDLANLELTGRVRVGRRLSAGVLDLSEALRVLADFGVTLRR